MLTSLSWLTSFGVVSFLILVYIGFLISDRGTFQDKLLKAFPDPDPERAQITAHIIA